MTETWLPVVGYEGIYEVSDRGRVKRVAGGRGARAGRVLRGKVCRKGYSRMTFTVDRQQRCLGVHRLVLEAFVGPPPSVVHEGNHKDGDKANNHVSNLEWVTPQENVDHAHANGLRADFSGERNGRAKITAEQAQQIRALRGLERQIDTARRYGISDARVSQIQAGQGWTEPVEVAA